MQQSGTRQELLDDEVLIIEDGGEMPEVTYHGSLYYLTKDPDGPGLTLSFEDLLRLKMAVVERYRRIIIRDILVENREKGIYRGLARCAANWDRVVRFCQKEKFDLGTMADEVRAGLKRFFKTEVHDVITLGKQTSVNCSPDTLTDLFNNVGLDSTELPKEWKTLAP